MLGYAYLLALSLTWFTLSGLLGPLVLNRLPLDRFPRLQLSLWLGGLYSMLFSALTAFVSTGVLITSGYLSLKSVSAGLGNLGYVMLFSVLPWIGLGLFAALVALTITRLEPALAAARQTNQLLAHSGEAAATFEGLAVRILAVPFLAAALVELDHRPTIVITQGAVQQLTASELEAVYWHEAGHAVGQHNGLNRLARTAYAFAPKLPLTKHLPAVVEAACERLADRFALRMVSPESLASAGSKFKF